MAAEEGDDDVQRRQFKTARCAKAEGHFLEGHLWRISKTVTSRCPDMRAEQGCACGVPRENPEAGYSLLCSSMQPCCFSLL